MKAGDEWHIMIAERFGALPETTDGSGNPQAISTEDTIMLRRIFVGAAIASTIFAGTSAAYADYNKPEKDDKEVECNQTNSNGGLVPILNQLLNLNNSPINVNVLGNQLQQFEWCEDQD
ncbi:hypothetical protein [Nonomuraea dietziae]|uniref:hypothetical protein n=1 Tax=Nonomuraea dietziae TaxID=65515 RepID=UPI003442E8F2